jgi:ATP-dependent DNA ligase
VAPDADGRPSFSLLQNCDSAAVPLAYSVFDVMMLRGRSVTGEPLSVGRALLESKVLPTLSEPVRYVVPSSALTGPCDNTRTHPR